MPDHPDFQSTVADLSPAIQLALTNLCEAAQNSFQDDLSSIVLFGSAAEGRLRATSDINLMIVLRAFRQERVDAFREPLRLAHVSVRAATMFIMEAELNSAADLFAVKFGDIARRHRVLFGELPAALRTIPATAKKHQLREILMNLALRLRRDYALISLREEQLAFTVANTAGPLRTAAAALLELEGQTVASPKAALARIVQPLDGGDWLSSISDARESGGDLPAGKVEPLMFQIMTWVETMRQRLERLA